ncbi:transposase, IS66 family [Bathymodiolus japonicus methanotrophic gill symbiont]|uniref:IS66 family insertion sequence element accessory protein TnpB n=1 Tax=Bathymodiolus japonicus methanotrophic gill symbiont TaxID=113269 RepID=UPI001B5ED68A|nr:transposase, IS66 family [Bathymodiolus japonicus methanotrophic gill symbiont]
MINELVVNQVYLATGVTDMRKSINGLSLIVSEQLGHNPLAGSAFVFCNRSRDKLKILYWECNGFWLYYRRLDKGKFQWPNESNEQTLTLNLRELHWLLDGLSYQQVQAHIAVSGLKNN